MVTDPNAPARKLMRSVRSNTSASARAEVTSDEYFSSPMNRHLPNRAPATQNLPAPEPISTTVRIPTSSSHSADRFCYGQWSPILWRDQSQRLGQEAIERAIVGAGSGAHRLGQVLRCTFPRR